jgi:hypothetical protein
MPLRELKQLVLRLIAEESIRPGGGDEEVEQQARVGKMISDAFLDLAPIKAQLASSTSTVEDIVRHQLQRVDAIAEKELSSDDRRRFDRFVDALKKRSGKLCSDCVRPAQQACSNGTGDAKLLEHPGLCIKKINDCYETMLVLAKRLIDSWGFAEGANQTDTCTVELERHFIGGHGRARAPPGKRHHVSGTTVFNDPVEIGFRRTTIKVELDGRFFNLETLHCVPWIFAHELFCHAFQGRTGVSRDPCERDCPFYEGWMDEVAFRVLVEGVYERLNLPGKQIPLANVMLDNPMHVVTEAGEFRKWRYGPKNADGTYPYPQSNWFEGSLAVEDLYQFFVSRNRRNDPHPTALKLMCRLSYLIQSKNPTPLQASELTLCLGLLAAEARRQDLADEADQVYDIIWQDCEIPIWINMLKDECMRRGLWDAALDNTFN